MIDRFVQLRSGFVAHSCWKFVSTALLVCLFGLFSNSLIQADDHAADHGKETAHAGHADASHETNHDESHGVAHGHGHHGPYTIWADLPFWSLIAFIGFVIAIKVLGLWDLLLNNMSDREKAESDAIVQAEADLTEARNALRSSKGRIEALDEQIRETMAEAGRDAQSTKDDILAVAEREAKASVERARHEIDRVQDQSLNEIFESMATKVADVTESRLRTGLGAGDHDRLIGSTLEELAIR
ncbi:hypothetical protein SH661x_004044 [Planctomicrobium sp. SH661]|uniref:F0F1 ATP synthase subunit B family protein n=1 Tax=Planctomicrobium sp. SH661 TaxID=3448124 RepID=UPI003F5BE477